MYIVHIPVQMLKSDHQLRDPDKEPARTITIGLYGWQIVYIFDGPFPLCGGSDYAPNKRASFCNVFIWKTTFRAGPATLFAAPQASNQRRYMGHRVARQIFS